MMNFWNRAVDWSKDGGLPRFLVFSLHVFFGLCVLILAAAVAFVFVVELLEWYALALIPLSYAFWIAVILRQTTTKDEFE